MLKILLYLRSVLTRIIMPADRYFLAVKSLKPISAKYGFDRGTPIDRFWIESFLEENKRLIRGICLEVTDAKYTNKYGEGHVVKSDILDINPGNKLANIHGDLKNLKSKIKDNTYDCLILTHVLGLIDDYDAALSECFRILKPGGALLYTGSYLGGMLGKERVYWRFTPNAVKYVLGKYFKSSKIKVKQYGNVLAGQCFWVGMSQEELTRKELEFNDPRYPCAVSAVAVK